VNLRYTPELIFQKDTTGPRGDRILSILHELEGSSGNQEDSPDRPLESEDHHEN
jgi:hypothetical protein